MSVTRHLLFYIFNNEVICLDDKVTKPSGSQPIQQEKKKAEKVISGEVKKEKKTGIGKLADIFIAEDLTAVKDYLFEDVAVPSIKQMIYSGICNGASMILFGEIKRSDGSAPFSIPGAKVAYDQFSKKNDSKPSSDISRSAHDIDNIVLTFRGDAEVVMECMNDIVSTYGMVSVADLYELLGQPSDWTDNKYGWKNLRNASIVRTHNGYWLKLPRVIPLDD